MKNITKMKGSTSDIVYDIIKDEIITGELAPGDRLIESDLAKRLEISRTPLREALKLLEFEGFLTKNLGSGVRVSELSIEELEDMYETERVLESVVLENITDSWEEGDLDQLEKIVQRIKIGYNREKNNDSEKIKKRYLKEYNELNVEFHKELLNIYNNQIFLKIYDEIEGKHLRYAYFSFYKYKSRFIKASEEHMKIFDLIKNREGKKVAELAFKHKLRAEKTISKSLEKHLS
ncbi:MAG: GntR family transcriptional regulator [Bacillota bacterium]